MRYGREGLLFLLLGINTPSTLLTLSIDEFSVPSLSSTKKKEAAMRLAYSPMSSSQINLGVKGGKERDEQRIQKKGLNIKAHRWPTIKLGRLLGN